MHNNHGIADSAQGALALSTDMERRLVYTASMCPFCDDWNSELTKRMGALPQSGSRFLNGSPTVSTKQLSKHVGRHMEQLALFSLPRTHDEDGEASQKVDDPGLEQEDSDDSSGGSESTSGHPGETERDGQRVEHKDKYFEDHYARFELSKLSTDKVEIEKEYELLDSFLSNSLLPSTKHLEQDKEEPMNDTEQGPNGFKRSQEELERSQDIHDHSDDRLELTREEAFKSLPEEPAKAPTLDTILHQQPMSEPEETEGQRRNTQIRSADIFTQSSKPEEGSHPGPRAVNVSNNFSDTNTDSSMHRNEEVCLTVHDSMRLFVLI